jgi:hypothetical protein
VLGAEGPHVLQARMARRLCDGETFAQLRDGDFGRPRLERLAEQACPFRRRLQVRKLDDARLAFLPARGDNLKQGARAVDATAVDVLTRPAARNDRRQAVRERLVEQRRRTRALAILM